MATIAYGVLMLLTTLSVTQATQPPLSTETQLAASAAYAAASLNPAEAARLNALYRARLQLLWSDAHASTQRAVALIEVMRHADDYGLTPNDYGIKKLSDAAARVPFDERSAIDFDVLLSSAMLRFVCDLHYGRVDPSAADLDLRVKRSDAFIQDSVIQLAATADLNAALLAMEPKYEHYALLKAALHQYRKLAADTTLTALPAIGSHALKSGDIYRGMPALRRLLHALGDLPEIDNSADSQSFTPDVVAAIKHFQTRHGMSADGEIGAHTFAELTTPLSTRIRQMELTLERWRWLPPLTGPSIFINIPQFRLFAFSTQDDSESLMLQMKVIVGKSYPRTRTPVFIGELRYVVFQPYWDVPRSITVREIIPKLKSHPSYLEQNHFELVNGPADGSPVVPATSDNLAALQSGKLRLRQRPGADNALGNIKFMLPNEHNVYLHGTPEQSLFDRAQRTFSHGCIRVNDPKSLAIYALSGNAQEQWDAAKIEEALHGPPSTRVYLKHPISVMILYGTALASEAGNLLFFDDVYGYDGKLNNLLTSISAERDRGWSKASMQH